VPRCLLPILDGEGDPEGVEGPVPPRETIEKARKLRRRLTPPEARLWFAIKDRKLEGLKFRRQHPIGQYVLDFYCPAARLAVEVDGQGHEHPEQIEADERRTRWLGTRGVRVMRVVAEEVRVNLDGVLESILVEVRKREG
jgi:very-short-patch-repair endonuclease